MLYFKNKTSYQFIIEPGKPGEDLNGNIKEWSCS